MKITEDFLKIELSNLSYLHQIVFAASCCERLLPNYLEFEKDEKWGDFKLLRSSLNSIWEMVKNKTIDVKEAKELAEKCVSVIPDSENFSSQFTSAAIDAGTCVYETLMFCVDRSIQRILDVSTLSLDTVDMYLQDLLKIDYSERDFEKKINEHPLMLQEKETQLNDIRTLKESKKLNARVINLFKKQKSNIKI